MIHKVVSGGKTFASLAQDRHLLTLMLFVDWVFIATHMWLWTTGHLTIELSIESDSGLPELFNYLKWLVSAGVCFLLFFHRRAGLYLIWALLFLYLGLDDANQIHERFGAKLVSALDIGGTLALRGQDFGELAVSLAAGLVLLGSMAAAYRRSGSTEEAVGFTRRQLPWLGVLIFCGVVVDMIHVQARFFGSPTLVMIFGVIEDGGEMIACSILTAGSVRHAVS